MLKRFITHLWTLTSEELRDLVLRRRALLGLLLYASVVVSFVVLLASLDRLTLPIGAALRNQAGPFSDVISWLKQLGLSEELDLLSQVSDWPAPVLVMQIFSLMWFPSLVALVSCDMISIDLYRGTLRYLVGRTGRRVYFLSKLLAHAGFYAFLQIFTFAALYVAVSRSSAGFDSELYLYTIGRCLMVFMPFLVFIITTTAVISCWSSRPVSAIIRLHVLWIAFLSLLAVDSRISPLSGSATLGLIAPVGEAARQSMQLLTLWSAGFAAAGLWIIRARRL